MEMITKLMKLVKEAFTIQEGGIIVLIVIAGYYGYIKGNHYRYDKLRKSLSDYKFESEKYKRKKDKISFLYAKYKHLCMCFEEPFKVLYKMLKIEKNKENLVGMIKNPKKEFFCSKNT